MMLTEGHDARATALGRAKEALLANDASRLAAAVARLKHADPPRADADVQYALGRCLAALGKSSEAVEAWERAIVLQPMHAPAHYSLGLELAHHGQPRKAAEHWETTLASDPRHVDAKYNLGQAYYSLGRYEDALAEWIELLEESSDDVSALKKIVQAHRALSRHEAADSWTQRLIAACRAHGAGSRGKPEYVVVDQFRVGGTTVLAQELVSPPESDFYVPLVFTARAADGKQLCAVQLESSAYARERGVPFILGIARAGSHRTIGQAFASRPPYPEVRYLAAQLVAAEARAAETTSGAA